MQIIYDTGIIGKEHAEERITQIEFAIRKSKLDFICELVPYKGGYNIKISTSVEIFDSWADMEEYIRQLIVKHNKFWNKPENKKALELLHE